MTRRVMPGSGIKRKLAHVVVVLKSAKRPAVIQAGPRMAASKTTPSSSSEIIALQNRGDGAPVRSCDTLWCNGLGHDVEGGGQRRDANLLIEVDLEIRRVSCGLRRGEFGDGEI